MALRLVDEHFTLPEPATSQPIVVEQLTGPGELLDRGYELLQSVFQPEVLDPKSVYEQRMSASSFAVRDFYPCFAIATCSVGADCYVAGFLSADLMWIDNSPTASFLAIGNIATSPYLKAQGVRGVGTQLLNAAITQAKLACQQDGRQFVGCLSEAEPASLGFWRKSGFRWPQGCHYLQPPLEFEDDGTPKYTEVPETLLIAPSDSNANTIAADQLTAMLRTLFENWCLRGWRSELSPTAIAKAENYVMGQVLQRIVQHMPQDHLVLSKDFIATPTPT
jgi:hypothetical protein